MATKTVTVAIFFPAQRDEEEVVSVNSDVVNN